MLHCEHSMSSMLTKLMNYDVGVGMGEEAGVVFYFIVWDLPSKSI